MAIVSLVLDPGAQNYEDQTINVRNETGSAMAAGDLVYVTGWSEAEGRWLIDLAEATPLDPVLAQWVLPAALANLANGIVSRSHRLTAVDTSAGAVGDPVYLSDSTPGGFTLTAPDFDRQIVGRIAVVGVSGEVEFLILPDTDAGFIKTLPGSGQYPIRAIHRQADGTVTVEYDNVAAP